jgi:mannan endo-1,6-alpha-mannosidase
MLYLAEAGVNPPLTNQTGGTSTGDFNAGSRGGLLTEWGPITKADRAGAGVLTALMLVGGLSTWAWMSTSFWEGTFD